MTTTPFFELIKRIKEGRSAPHDEDFKEYQPFLVCRFLSMNIPNIPAAAFLNKYAFLPWDKKHHFEMMRCLPWDSSFVRYIKGEKDNDKMIKEVVLLVEQAWKGTSVKRSEIIEMLNRNIISLDELDKILLQLGIETKKRNRINKWYKEKVQ